MHQISGCANTSSFARTYLKVRNLQTKFLRKIIGIPADNPNRPPPSPSGACSVRRLPASPSGAYRLLASSPSGLPVRCVRPPAVAVLASPSAGCGLPPSPFGLPVGCVQPPSSLSSLRCMRPPSSLFGLRCVRPPPSGLPVGCGLRRPVSGACVRAPPPSMRRSEGAAGPSWWRSEGARRRWRREGTAGMSGGCGGAKYGVGERRSTICVSG